MPKNISQILTQLISLNNKTMNHIQDLIIIDDKTVIWATTHLRITTLKIKIFQITRWWTGRTIAISRAGGVYHWNNILTFSNLDLTLLPKVVFSKMGRGGMLLLVLLFGLASSSESPTKTRFTLPKMSKKSCLASELAVFWGKTIGRLTGTPRIYLVLGQLFTNCILSMNLLRLLWFHSF